ncbi:hypothetical protein BSPWISOXPB_10945 [uncultured Gammaproteobacteria bacterium]|nr:hypothetical protein BSPWISOXPB_10945 [uncultured Gammaproteobacteria bacterium]
MSINQSVTLCLIPNATNTKAEGTRVAVVAVEVCNAYGDVQTATIHPISRTTPQVGARANRANRAIRAIAVASNWDSQEAGEGAGITSNISTDSICRSSASVGTLKPAGQMSLAPPFAQASIRLAPLLSMLVQSQGDTINKHACCWSDGSCQYCFVA